MSDKQKRKQAFIGMLVSPEVHGALREAAFESRTTMSDLMRPVMNLWAQLHRLNLGRKEQGLGGVVLTVVDAELERMVRNRAVEAGIPSVDAWTAAARLWLGGASDESTRDASTT